MRGWLRWLFPHRQRNLYALVILVIIAIGVIAAGVARLIPASFATYWLLVPCIGTVIALIGCVLLWLTRP